MDERSESRILFLAAIALGLFGVFAPYKWHEMPAWLTNTALALALFLGLWAAFLSIPVPAKGAKKLIAAFLIAAGISAAICGLVLYFDQTASEVAEEPKPPVLTGPDVTLRFVYADRPAILLMNGSDKLAKEIKWTVVLWNLNDPRTFSPNPHAPDAHEPLQIPVSTFDFIRPYSKGGPQVILGAPVSNFIKAGDHLVGSASVICPDCTRGHTYVVSIIVDSGGWFAEIDNIIDGSLVIPPRLTKQLVIEYAKQIDSIQLKDRIVITDP